MTKTAVIRIAPEILVNLCKSGTIQIGDKKYTVKGIPEDAKYESVTYKWIQNEIHLTVTSDSFPEDFQEIAVELEKTE